MNIKDEFMTRIEAEHGEFFKKIGRMDTAEIISDLPELSRFKTMYDYVKNNTWLGEDNYEELLKYENPIATLCRTLKNIPMNEQKVYNEAIESVLCGSVSSIECTDKVRELLKRLEINYSATYDLKEGAEHAENILDSIEEIASEIKDEDAEILLQFKNPLEIIMSLSPKEETPTQTIKDAVDYVNDRDVLTLPHEIDYEGLLEESKWKHQAVNAVINIVPKTDFKITMRWLDLFRNIERECGNIYENDPYDAFVSALYTICDEQGDEILQQLYDMGRENCILASELVEAAKYLADGGDIAEVPELANKGYFETFNEPQQDGMNMC